MEHEQPTWTCPACKENCEDQFESCWNCGTGRDGSEPPEGFDSSKERIQKMRSIDALLAEQFKCIKCGNSSAKTKRIAMTGTGLSKLIDIQHNTFIALSCDNCGYTEFYNPEILRGKSYLGTTLDIVF